MVATLKRQLSDEEKTVILSRYGRCCFSNGHAIPDDDQVQFDHIHAHGLGGDSELNNIAPMCAQHNKEKGQLPIGDFRIKLQLNSFFAAADKPTLRDFLKFLVKEKRIAAFGHSTAYQAEGSTVEIDAPSGSFTHTLYKCPTTGWHYFYATLDVSILDSDDETDDKVGLQPRYPGKGLFLVQALSRSSGIATFDWTVRQIAYSII